MENPIIKAWNENKDNEVRDAFLESCVWQFNAILCAKLKRKGKCILVESKEDN
jgi:hypothetical protein